MIRGFVGYDRYSGPVAGQTMAHLYGAMRRYVNYFHPSFKLLEKTRYRATIVKRYSPPDLTVDTTIFEMWLGSLSKHQGFSIPVA